MLLNFHFLTFKSMISQDSYKLERQGKPALREVPYQWLPRKLAAKPRLGPEAAKS